MNIYGMNECINEWQSGFVPENQNQSFTCSKKTHEKINPYI